MAGVIHIIAYRRELLPRAFHQKFNLLEFYHLPFRTLRTWYPPYIPYTRKGANMDRYTINRIICVQLANGHSQ